QAQFAGMYAAAQKVFYEEEGINVSFLEGGIGVNEVEIVFSGEADFGLIWGVDLFKAEAENIQVTAIAVVNQISPSVYISLKESGIEKPQDFINKKVGVRPGSGAEIRHIAMLKNLGINSSDVIEVPVGYNMTLFFNGEVDVWPGYITGEVIEAEEKGYEVNIINSEEYGVHIYTNVLFTTDEMITNNSDLVQRFLDATIKGKNKFLWYTLESMKLVGCLLVYGWKHKTYYSTKKSWRKK
ncbi:MAG: ABC transporter substrate-binding protein, partial [Candidatus Hodarchaeales archaeon]